MQDQPISEWENKTSSFSRSVPCQRESRRSASVTRPGSRVASEEVTPCSEGRREVKSEAIEGLVQDEGAVAFAKRVPRRASASRTGEVCAPFRERSTSRAECS